MSSPLTVVVPTRDRPAMLADCLAALRADLPDGDVIVVDSASRDAAAVAAVAHQYGARLIRLDQPGTSRARNAGWRQSATELVAFVDDDVRVRPGWARALAADFDRPDVAFVTGAVVVPDRQARAERPVAVTSRTQPMALHPGLDGDLGASANLGVRRDVLELVGGFDPRLGPGSWAASAEDLDLFDRIFGHGRHGWFAPAACAEHEQWRSKPQLLRLDWRYGKGMGVRLARLRRSDPTRARRLWREAMVTQGLQPVCRDLRQGYEFGALTVAIRMLGSLVGGIVGRLGRL
ncbi:MAG TPA: glycosyltransferase [Mycobacteriales bacterium]|nr:glycosyltransferase [Mycobacteriales bacterium]